MEKMGGAGRQVPQETPPPPFLVQNECDCSPFAHQSVLMKDHFMGTEQTKLFEIPFFSYLNNCCLYGYL